ncbi:MAG: hypothetical protein ACJAT7_003709, partial [Psychromonas sp.]|uniref:choice-of-anchor H family protein n=1 Tax=Psychromonas sp. TaxID=1884585 RepID=UPI0039E5219B
AVNNVKDEQLTTAAVRSVFSALLMIFLTAFISRVNAGEQQTTQATVSYGVLSETINNEMRLNIAEQNNSVLISDQISGKATGKNRDEIMEIEEVKQITSRSYAPEFTIYNAFTTLQNDFDSDGFYQTFSVVFDADLYSYDNNDLGEVYARLYISEDGGPWIHYYSSDDFIIHGESDQDEYEVITTFREGYHSGHYDILIDLYQVGYDGIVATYSADDNSALYALPLESADYDRVYVDSVYIQHGGSLSTVLLILLALLLASRVLLRFKMRG